SLTDVGTRVDVYLPAISGPLPVAAPIERQAAVSANNERILLVDDDRTLLGVTREILIRLGYVVDAHNEPEVALRTFTDNPDAWDLVITDRSMPKMTGEELARSIKRIRPDIPILMLSGFVSGDDAGQLM